MHTLQKSSSGTAIIPLETRLFASRKVFLEGLINSESANEFVKQIMFLVDEDRNRPINIYINSYGGEVTSGLLIYDSIKRIPCETNLFCMDTAASMAAIILAGGQKGHRFILPHSRCMLHEPLLPGGVGGSATEIYNTAEAIIAMKDKLAELIANDTGKSLEEVKKAISFDNYMNAEEAKEFGLVDQIVESVFD